MKREPGYLYIEYRGDTKRYCIRCTAGEERISRYYADRVAVDNHVARLRERGWRWAKEEEK